MKTPHFINTGNNGPVVLICAGVHGDEYEPIMAVYQLQELLTNKISSGKVILVPFVNGTAVSLHSRYGDDGLDLARICPGKTDGSSSEKDAAEISSLIRSSDYLIDLHTGGRIFDIFPMAGYMIHPSLQVLDKQREMAKAFGLPVIWGTDHEPNGRTLSVARDAMVPAIYVEYGGGSTTRKEIVSSYVDGCLRVIVMLGMLSDQPGSPQPLKYWIEDPTPLKGHLQSKMPSPIDGIFSSSVVLGQEITKGEVWGQVVDLETGKSTEVFAEDTGLVLFLRSDTIVKAGDSLGGVMSVNSKNTVLHG
ncbi:MAG TPA: M14 family metallopeptidase [Chitinophagaceae bacterium]|nr:M14 family metallopeptidase [Chitinophagaceae bacterium]